MYSLALYLCTERLDPLAFCSTRFRGFIIILNPKVQNQFLGQSKGNEIPIFGFKLCSYNRALSEQVSIVLLFADQNDK